MAQQSSAVVALRAVIMLACVVAIPLVAMFGSSLPEVLKAAREGRWPDLSKTTKAATNAPPLDEAPKFAPAPAAAPPPAAMIAAPSEPPAVARQAAPSPSPLTVPAGPIASAAPPAVAVPPGESEPTAAIVERLRQMGATYFILEPWGDRHSSYRFFCKMAIGGNSNYTQSFWAVEPDPLQAMTQVLKQVENWRSRG